MKQKLFRLPEKTICDLQTLVDRKRRRGEPTSEAAEVRSALVRYLAAELVERSAWVFKPEDADSPQDQC